LEEMEKLRYINIKQVAMIQYKITTRNLEIKNHMKHFEFMIIQL